MRDILKGTEAINVGFTRQLGSGSTIFFRNDRLCSKLSLFSFYPNLFHIASDHDLLVIEAFQLDYLNIFFTRQLTGVLRND